MNANEFRLGNWIRDKDSEYQITHLCYDDVWYDEESIPLTEEWLLDFGFAHTEFDFSAFEEIKGCYELNKLLLDQSGEDVVSLIIDELYIEIKHVHQLQNLYFALTGKELIKK